MAAEASRGSTSPLTSAFLYSSSATAVLWHSIRPAHLVCSRWKSTASSGISLSFYVLLAFRTSVALWVSGPVLFPSMIDGGVAFFKFFTNCNLTLLCLYFILSSVLSWWYLFQRSSFELRTKLNLIEKLTLFLLVISFVNSLFLDIVYWALLKEENEPVDFFGLNAHALNSIAVFLELLLNRIELRDAHYLLVFCFNIPYLIFSWIYFAIYEEWIYFFLDWNQGLLSLGFYCLSLGANVVFFYTLMLTILVRNVIANKFVGEEDAVSDGAHQQILSAEETNIAAPNENA